MRPDIRNQLTRIRKDADAQRDNKRMGAGSFIDYRDVYALLEIFEQADDLVCQAEGLAKLNRRYEFQPTQTATVFEAVENYRDALTAFDTALESRPDDA